MECFCPLTTFEDDEDDDDDDDRNPFLISMSWYVGASEVTLGANLPADQLMSYQSIWKENEEVGVIEVAVIEHLMVVVGEFCLIFGRNNIMYMNIVMI